MRTKAWLADVPWDMVVWQNRQLCDAKHAHHGPTSDGYQECRELGEEKCRVISVR